MKSILMAFVAVTAFQMFSESVYAQSMTFDQAPSVASPIEITVLSTSYSSGFYKLHDENMAQRIAVGNRSVNDVSTPWIGIYNSSEAFINGYEISAEEKSQLLLIISRASRTCPVKILINRETRKIERVSPTCDELAELAPTSQNG